LQSGQDVGIKFGGSEGVAGSDVSEAYQGVHEGQLSWVVEFESRDAFTAGKHRGLCQVVELSSVNKAFQDILLDVKIVVANGREPVTELGEVFDGLFDPIGGHVISGRLGAQAQVIANVLFEGAVCVVSANDGVGQIEVFNDSLKLSLVVLGHLTAEDGGDLAGLADGAVGIQESLVQLIQCGAPVKDEVVAILHLGEKEPVLTAATFAFAFFEEGSQAG
jgi:hypothetical protein